jgi:phosphatidylserine/phosphatidylglycerophosphate/cardiolipin synthase-like enzyme
MDAWVRDCIDDDHISTRLDAAAIARLDHAPSPRSLELLRERIAELQRCPSIRGSVPMQARTRFHDLSVRVVTVRSRVRGDDNPAVEAVLDAIAGARREIVIQSLSFILKPQPLKAFRRASNRGVAITLLTNSPLSSGQRRAGPPRPSPTTPGGHPRATGRAGSTKPPTPCCRPGSQTSTRAATGPHCAAKRSRCS